MIRSMTGFGKHVVQLPSKKITVELKSLNSKSLDLNARMPSSYREKELELRKLIAASLERGKIDFALYVEPTGDETTGQVNEGTVRRYMKQLRAIADGDELRLLEMALRMPDALKSDREDLDEQEYAQIVLALEAALVEINTFRSEEGMVLEKDFLERIKILEALLDAVLQMDPQRTATIRERLEKAVKDIKEEVDENRFEQELIYYFEKLDITEEIVRLGTHLDYFSKNLHEGKAQGKKLGFIGQELGREINTIGSKANDAQIQKHVIIMKDELEKIKEQSLNIL